MSFALLFVLPMKYIWLTMYLLGYDIGSSSIKAALVDADTGHTLGLSQYPPQEMSMIAHRDGWAEQEPEEWWNAVCRATQLLLANTGIAPEAIQSIGISYQMHGLVLVDKNQKVLRPSIIWCDSRSVDLGKRAFEALGPSFCLTHYLNSPGNFTASKLRWVQENEPEIFDQIDKIMLPGDFIAMKLSGIINTTVSGLSEGILWDFEKHQIAHDLCAHYGIPTSFIPDIVDSFAPQGSVTKAAATASGLPPGIPIAYRAGDQPNNALSLGVMQPGEIAATGGTSGVVYGITSQKAFDPQSRINSFAHVNHSQADPRIGLLLCINGAGIQYSWMKHQLSEQGIDYPQMESLLSTVPVGADGLRIIPFGNGAERMINNRQTGAQVNNLQFNIHTRAHLYRAALEGIAFSFIYGIQLLKDFALDPQIIKVGNDNLFQSTTFSSTIANLLACEIQVIATTGAVGAAKASGYGAGHYSSIEAAIRNNEIVKTYRPEVPPAAYQKAFEKWVEDLEKLIAAAD